MTRRLLVLALLAAAPLAAQSSGATFTAVSANAPSTFTTAADFNTVSVAIDDPGSPLRGTVRLQATASSQRGIAWVRFEAAPAGGTGWTTICTDSAAPYECDWATSPDGLRDVRAVARDAAGYERTAVRAARRVDNTAPALTFAPPAGVTGTAALSFGAKETNGSGIATDGVVLDVRPSGGSTWTQVCRSSAESGICNWSTTVLAEGDYVLRLAATDSAGNRAEKLVTTKIDRGSPTAAMTERPPDLARGTVKFTVDAADLGSGIERVVFEAKQNGTATWYAACTVMSAPYTCSGDTRSLVVPGFGTVQVPDGLYDLRGAAYDAAGNVTYTTPVTFRVDNTGPRGTDVQGANGGVAGTLDAGDRFTLTYGEAVVHGTIAAGWDGTTPLTVTVRVAADDTLTIWDAGNAAQLGLTGSVQLNRDVTGAGAAFTGTLTRSGNAYAVTLGQLVSGAVNAAAAAPAALRWTPSPAVTDAAGNPAATTPATETGAEDADL
jgi:hypothetical protein